jgi:hypothetical protein
MKLRLIAITALVALGACQRHDQNLDRAGADLKAAAVQTARAAREAGAAAKIAAAGAAAQTGAALQKAGGKIREEKDRDRSRD